ncbi:multidrug resistance protein MdtA [Mariprofundus micogutta]|uniref:Multidrug resistance protein MdtA n=1 Tax=Mariprofundus micogutta TaxID=1921010 RepID=A0A1L8CP85_9PROT|nr:efflux RND transporter periplasmic adaptor subunit [Mariprofundus micogutta]GAV20732.1 multidrug resistance protein MdtA [Mariprofundus micogutta]
MKTGIRLFISLLVLAGLQACGGEEGQMQQSAAPAVQAETMTVKAVAVAENYVTSGTVTSDHRVAISSRLSGYIRELAVREGDKVKAGDVLVRVDPVNARQGLVQAQADLADAKADKDRYEELFAAHAVSKQQLDRVSLRYKVARSQVEQARNQLGYAEVRSPVAGVVVEKRMNKGDLASPGAAILVLEDPDSLLVETYVSEQFVSGIKIGDKVEIEVATLKQSFAGVVRQVVEAADAVSHQFLIKISLNGESGVHPGMYAMVGFKVGERPALEIPAAAVIERSGLHGVYIVDANGITRYRQIRLGKPHANGVEVLAGLRDGDVIAWNATPSAQTPALQTGMKVLAK